MTDNDLKTNIIGFSPRINIKNPQLREIFQEKCGRDFLGGDEIIAYSQSAVSSEVNFAELEEEISGDIDSGKPLNETIFKKTATGIGRGHSLGGLTNVTLGIHGTKMVDSGLTGICMSRSLVTSGRRRAITTDEIVIPEALLRRKDLLDEYLKISRDALDEVSKFKEKFGNLKGVETANKLLAYNNPADLLIELPLDSLATIANEVEADKSNPNGHFLPRELHTFSDLLPEITDKIGQGIMFGQRIKVPRDTYLHYNVFKDPSKDNYALELGKRHGMTINPIVTIEHADFTRGFNKRLKELEKLFEETRKITDPKKLHEASMRNMRTMHEFVNEYNGALGLNVIDSISWRVWSEQKRHSTLKQGVESVYSGAGRAYINLREIWPLIQKIYQGQVDFNHLPTEDIEKSIVIDEKLKQQPELLIPYIYHSVRELMMYGKLKKEGLEERDALYMVPRNIRLAAFEKYDLANLIDLELPLRLCSTCEPERQTTSWRKRDAIAEALPEIKYFLQPKCNVGFCTEGKPCKHIIGMREDYTVELHNQTKEIMLEKSKR